MNIIFLDIDGVLITTRSTIAKVGSGNDVVLQYALDQRKIPYYQLDNIKNVDPVAVRLINELIKETNSGLVLSSTHRTFFYNQSIKYGSGMHMALLQTYLEALGIILPSFFDITPIVSSRHRGAEIDMWLSQHTDIVDKFTIIDDDSDFLDNQLHRLVQTDSHNGFSFYDHNLALVHLHKMSLASAEAHGLVSPSRIVRHIKLMM
jgi:HAD domain in Swiss Army Knife RNA repair proteins